MENKLPPLRHWIPKPPAWWRKVRPLRWLLLLSVLGYGGYFYYLKISAPPPLHPETAAFSSRANTALQLMPPFSSYDSVTVVKSRLGALTPEQRSLSRPSHPSFPVGNRDTLLVANYVDNQVEGSLRLEFFNDRLFEIEFQPSNPENYRGRLYRRYSKLRRDANGKAELTQGDLRLSTNIDYAITPVGKKLNTTAMVLWQDSRLVNQLEDWQQRFGALPEVLKAPAK
jgi:hypothetical protein